MSTQVKQQHNNLDLKETLIKYKSLVGLLALILVVSILSPSFLSTKNIFNILKFKGENMRDLINKWNQISLVKRILIGLVIDTPVGLSMFSSYGTSATVSPVNSTSLLKEKCNPYRWS